MCDAAWALAAGRVRASALADRGAYLAAGEDPPDPEARAAQLREAVVEPLESDSLTPQMRRLRTALGI
jgi:hypothetical protein